MPDDGGTVFTAVGWGVLKLFSRAFIDHDYPICRIRLSAEFLAPEPLSLERQSVYPFAEEARQMLRAILIPQESERGAAARIACAYLDKKDVVEPAS